MGRALIAEVVLAFTSREAQQLTALTARRLLYWDQTDFISPSISPSTGRGSPRLYAFRDLVQLRVASTLREDLSLQALRRLKAALDGVEEPFATLRFARVPDSREFVYLGPAGHPEAVKRPGQIVVTFDVPLQEIRVELADKIVGLRKRRGVGELERRRGILGGRERIAGTRIAPAVIRRMVAAGWSTGRILEEYPELEAADVAASILAGPLRRKAG